jgi:hypothetical protein
VSSFVFKGFKAMKKTIILILLLLISATISYAANCRVTRADDRNNPVCLAGDCSLREAVADTDCASVDFSLDLVDVPLLLTMGEINIIRSITISGWGADAIVISPNNVSRVFTTAAGTAVAIGGVTLVSGNGAGAAEPHNGGAIRALGSLTLDGVWLKGNTATGMGSAVAFEGPGPSLVRNSTFSDNTGPAITGAAVAIKSGAGQVDIYNSTVTANTAGGIYFAGAIVKLVNSTVTGGSGPGIYIGGMANLDLGNSIALDICRCSTLGGMISRGNNIVSAASGSSQLTFHASDLVGVNPLLGLLRNNGGSTRTLALLPGSPGIDAGNNTLAADAGLTTDQRGHLRFFDGDGSGSSIADIGAFEFGAANAAALVSVSGRVLTASGMPVRSMSVSITDLQGNTRHAFTSSLGWFTFDQLPGGRVYNISISSKRYHAPDRVVAGQDQIDTDIIATPLGK